MNEKDNTTITDKDLALSPLLDKITTLETKISNLEKQVEDTTRLNRELLNRKKKEDDRTDEVVSAELFSKFLLEEN